MYPGTFVNEYTARGGMALGMKSGSAYVDDGTVHGYRTVLRLLE